MLAYNRFVLKTDQEPAIIALVEAIKREAAMEIIPEHSPVHESASTGEIERAIQEVQGQVRTNREAIKAKYQQEIEGTHPVMPWLIRHSAAQLNRYKVGNDGKTAHERMRGRKFKNATVEMAECVWYLDVGTEGIDKLETRWESGIWLGVRDESGEMIIGTKEGVIKVRTIRRKGTTEERCNK